MIVVDSSVWIAKFRGRNCREVGLLEGLIDDGTLLLGDAVLLELLQGVRTERELNKVFGELNAFEIQHMLSPALAVKAAENYRLLRRRGITVRKTIDLIIGTFCIECGFSLLHLDRDFRPMAEHLGLQLM